MLRRGKPEVQKCQLISAFKDSFSLFGGWTPAPSERVEYPGVFFTGKRKMEHLVWHYQECRLYGLPVCLSPDLTYAHEPWVVTERIRLQIKEDQDLLHLCVEMSQLRLFLILIRAPPLPVFARPTGKRPCGSPEYAGRIIYISRGLGMPLCFVREGMETPPGLLPPRPDPGDA